MEVQIGHVQRVKSITAVVPFNSDSKKSIISSVSLIYVVEHQSIEAIGLIWLIMFKLQQHLLWSGRIRLELSTSIRPRSAWKWPSHDFQVRVALLDELPFTKTLMPCCHDQPMGGKLRRRGSESSGRLWSHYQYHRWRNWMWAWWRSTWPNPDWLLLDLLQHIGRAYWSWGKRT